MMRLVAAAIALSMLTLACGGDAEDVPRTIDVATLTFEDVQQRALAATERPGEVLHVTTTSGDLTASPSEAWVDRERNLGRSEDQRSIAIYHDDRVALLSPLDRRFQDAAITSGVPAGALSIHALGYLDTLFTREGEYVRREVRAGEREGKPVIVVEIETEVYESSDTRLTETYLDEQFLPVELEQHQGGSRATVTIEYEFIPRDSLRADFFSVEAVRAAATTPLDDLRAARDAGLDPYWLGERFEDTVLRDESRFEDESEVEIGGSSLHLGYGPSDFFVPSPCVSMSQYSAEGWQQILERRADVNPTGDDGDIELTTLQLSGATATIYERPGAVIPRAPVTVDGPTPTGQPDLPVVPGDSGVYRIAVVRLDSGGVIEVHPNCGPVGTNIYRMLDAFERLVASLRPYDGP